MVRDNIDMDRYQALPDTNVAHLWNTSRNMICLDAQLRGRGQIHAQAGEASYPRGLWQDIYSVTAKTIDEARPLRAQVKASETKRQSGGTESLNIILMSTCAKYSGSQ